MAAVAFGFNSTGRTRRRDVCVLGKKGLPLVESPDGCYHWFHSLLGHTLHSPNADYSRFRPQPLKRFRLRSGWRLARNGSLLSCPSDPWIESRTGLEVAAARRRLEARVRIELTIEVLQTSALPLGYRAGTSL